MCLTGKDELHGVALVVDNLLETVKVIEDQVGTLIGGKAASKADKQGVRVDFINDVGNACGIALVLEPTLLEVALHEADKLVLQGHTHLPDFLVGDIHQGCPGGLEFLVVHEVVAQHLLVECFPLAGGPGGHVHTVGDVAHV